MERVWEGEADHQEKFALKPMISFFFLLSYLSVKRTVKREGKRDEEEKESDRIKKKKKQEYSFELQWEEGYPLFLFVF